MSRIANRLAELGIALPAAAPPVASYVPVVISGDLAFVSGQVSIDASGGIKGRLGAGLSLEDGQRAARLCGLNLMAQLALALGELDRVRRVVKLSGFVNVTPDFGDIPQVVNGCSDLLVEVFGEAGRHSRAAVGVANLPFGFAVEVEGVFEVG